MASTISAGTTSGTAIAIAGDTSGQLQLQTNGTTTAVTIGTNQCVGIGITNPTQPLQISGGSATEVDLFVSGTRTGTLYVDNSQMIIDAVTAIPMIFRTADTERMRIDSSGNLFIATTSTPIGGNTGQLNMSNAYNSGYFAIAINSTTTSGNQNLIDFGRGGSQCGYIYSGATNSTSYLTSSDYRLKENIQPMTGALAKVNALKPVTYKWKQDGTSSQGFIAHELAEVVPEAVGGEKDELDADGNPRYQGIDTSFLVATLTAALQELNAKVDAQALEIQALKGVA